MINTIVALATLLGRSGIGVVRLSGGESLSITSKITGDKNFAPTPRQAHLKELRNIETREIIDEAILTYFKAPHSFTGEDVVEIACHGSPVVLRTVVDLCLKYGARMAEPGEFSLRAVASGRMDLTEAEAIRDLIDARTTASARQAIRQMRGEFSHSLQPVKDELLDIIVILESALEFVEDDLPETAAVDVRTRLNRLAEKLSAMAATFRAGNLLREGLRVAIIGRPNVGKSSLFNALLGSDHAIVTDIAGTTRDQLRETFTIGGIPVSLIDTAGLRQTTDTVESIGVERSRRTMADADLVAVMLDVSTPFADEDREILGSAAELEHIVILNKIDKVADERIAEFRANVSGETVVAVSALTGEGFEELRSAIVEPFADSNAAAAGDGFLVSDARHFDLLTRAVGEIENSAKLIEQRASEEITLIGLHNALRYLGSITGETTTEDMLTRIFSTFCIGK
jgi:tRNA modification GTPase